MVSVMIMINKNQSTKDWKLSAVQWNIEQSFISGITSHAVVELDTILPFDSDLSFIVEGCSHYARLAIGIFPIPARACGNISKENGIFKTLRP